MNKSFEIVADMNSLALEAAGRFTVAANEAVRLRGRFAVALSGGNTPKALYSLLAADECRARLPWAQMHFFWGDERHVPPGDVESNFRMTSEALLSKVPVPPANIHRILSEIEDAGKAAADYEQELKEFFSLAKEEFPVFDLILLGVGPDGHTASLFPGSSALTERQRLVVSNWVEKFQSYRITLTFPVLNNADSVMFLVSGADKADVIKSVYLNSAGHEQLPSQLVQPVHGNLLWLVDQAAARFVNSRDAR